MATNTEEVLSGFLEANRRALEFEARMKEEFPTHCANCGEERDADTCRSEQCKAERAEDEAADRFHDARGDL